MRHDRGLAASPHLWHTLGVEGAGAPRVRQSIAAYVAAWNERDPGARAKLLEQACADDFRILTPGRCIQGRDGLAALIADFQQRRPAARAELASGIEVDAHTFRYLGVVVGEGGPPAENLDTGEHDAEGRLVVVMTFAGAAPPG
jgi:hypothetical protein